MLTKAFAMEGFPADTNLFKAGHGTHINHLRFPQTFENGYGGRCPDGWRCSGRAAICSFPGQSPICRFNWLRPVEGMGQKFFRIGTSTLMAAATSDTFYLPSGISTIDFLHGGKAGTGSGLFVHLLETDEIICRNETAGEAGGSFVRQRCNGLSQYAGRPVYLCLVDHQRGPLGTVIFDDIHLRNKSGHDLDHAGIDTVTPANEPDCSLNTY